MRGESEIEEEKEEVNQVKKRRGEKSISKYACKLCVNYEDDEVDDDDNDDDGKYETMVMVVVVASMKINISFQKQQQKYIIIL